MNTIFRTTLISDTNLQSGTTPGKNGEGKIKGLDFRKTLNSLKEKGKTSEKIKSLIKDALQNMSDEECKKLLNELKALVDKGDVLSEDTMFSKIIKLLEDVDQKMTGYTSEKVSVDSYKIEEIIENLEHIGDLLEKISDGRISLKIEKEVEDPGENEKMVRLLLESGENERISKKEEVEDPGENEKMVKLLLESGENERISKKEESNNKTSPFEDLKVEEDKVRDGDRKHIIIEDVPDKVLHEMKKAVKEEVSEKVEVNNRQGDEKETIKTIEREFISKEGKKTILKTTIIVERIKLNQRGENDFDRLLRFSQNINQTNSNNNKETDFIERPKFLKGGFKTYSPDEMVQHITQRVKYTNVDGKQLMTMNLRPGELGEVKVLLSRVDGKMDIKIITESGEAKNTLLSGANELKTNLKSEGVNLNTFEITVNPDGRNSRDNKREQDEEGKQKKNRQRAKTVNFHDVMRAFGPIKRDLNINA